MWVFDEECCGLLVDRVGEGLELCEFGEEVVGGGWGTACDCEMNCPDGSVYDLVCFASICGGAPYDVGVACYWVDCRIA